MTTKTITQQQLIHKAYRLGIYWGLFIIAMAWNYTSTWEHNRMVALIQEANDRATIAEMAAAAGPELLPPPVLAAKGR